MKKTLKPTILILITLVLVLALFACANDGAGSGDDFVGGSGSGPVYNPPTQSEIISKINQGIRNGAEVADESVRFVKSEYTFIVQPRINVTIRYEANYNLNIRQDSEFLLKVTNNETAVNSLFFWYRHGNLYYQFNDIRIRETVPIVGSNPPRQENTGREFVGSRIEGFGGEIAFNLFFTLMRLFDLDSFFFADPDLFDVNDEFPDELNDFSMDTFAGYVASIIGMAEDKSISSLEVSHDREVINITNVVVDNLKDRINRFLRDSVRDGLGTRLDALTTILFGFNISDIGLTAINTLNAQKVSVILENETVKQVDILFNGVQSNNIDNFSLSMHYEIGTGAKAINPPALDDPRNEKNIYEPVRLGEFHYVGTVYIDSIDETFFSEIKGNLNPYDNMLNSFLVDIRNRSVGLDSSSPFYRDDSIASLFFKNEILFIGLEGYMNNYMTNSIALKDLGLPNVAFAGVDTASIFSSLLSSVIQFSSVSLSPMALLSLLSVDAGTDNGLSVLLSKINTVDGTKLEITIDKELLEILLEGDSSLSLTSFFTNLTGITPAMAESLIGGGMFDNLVLIYRYDYVTKDIELQINSGNERLCIFYLTAQKITLESGQTSFEFSAPEGFNENDYGAFVPPATVALRMDIEMQLQGVEIQNLSQLFGALIGDNSGKNSPFDFRIGDKLFIETDIWLVGEDTYLKAMFYLRRGNCTDCDKTINANEKLCLINPYINILNIYTLSTNADILLVEVKAMQGLPEISFRIPKSVVQEQLSEVQGEKGAGLFNTGSVMDIYNLLLRESSYYLMEDEYIRFALTPDMLDGVGRDPVRDIIGISGFTAVFNASIKFNMPNALYNGNENKFVVPEAIMLNDLAFDSIYEAYWQTHAEISFGAERFLFELSFTEDSAKLISGVFHYSPKARLFGLNVGYVMILRDIENGTKYIDALLEYTILIDPAEENPIPETVVVRYDDGTTGRQSFVLEGFSYTEDNIKNAMNGVPPISYRLIIGLGSMAETSFFVTVEILSRHIVTNHGSQGNIPVVAEITIDPYDFSQKRTQNSEYDPLASVRVIDLVFLNPDGTTYREQNLTFDWEFDTSFVTYAGAVVYVHSNFKELDVYLRVIVTPKFVDYISISYLDNGVKTATEERGEYTVDMLLRDTYRIPFVTSSTVEIRIYFRQAGDAEPRYRIVGAVGSGTPCEASDGWYHLSNIRWDIESAEENNLRAEGSLNPLRDGNRNTAINRGTFAFGDGYAGAQRFEMIVRAPSRLVQPETTMRCITTLVQNDGIISSDSVWEHILVSRVSHGNFGDLTYNRDGHPIEIFPRKDGATNRLPEHINMLVSYAGSVVRRAYKIEWIENSVIDADGNMKHSLMQETWLEVKGRIGNGAITQIVTLVVHNAGTDVYEIVFSFAGTESDIVHKPVPIPNPQDPQGPFIETKAEWIIKPYSNPHLPNFLRVIYLIEGEELLIEIQNPIWLRDINIQTNPSLPPIWQEETVSPTEVFPYNQGRYEVYVRLPEDKDKGLVSRKIPLVVVVEFDWLVRANYIYDITDRCNPSTVLTTGAVTVGTYEAESQSIHSLLVTYVGGQRIVNDITVGAMLSYNAGNSQEAFHGLPVSWNLNSLNTFIDCLESPLGSSLYPNGRVELFGYIYQGTVLEQRVNIWFIVPQSEITGLSFGNFAFGQSEEYYKILEIAVDLNLRLISINLDLAYALFNTTFASIYGYHSSPENHRNLLYDFIDYLFAKVGFGFEGLPGYQDHSVLYSAPPLNIFPLADGVDSVTVIFELYKLGIGSNASKFDIEFTFVRSNLPTATLSLFEEVFTAQGVFVYNDWDRGFPMPHETSVEYLLATNGNILVPTGNHLEPYRPLSPQGTRYQVNYFNLIWYSSEDYYADNGKVLLRDARVDFIPVEFFSRAEHLTFYTTLYPQGIRLSLQITFYQKNINLTAYNASGADSRYTISGGQININNIYDFYEFNPALLPNRIVPIVTSQDTSYQFKYDLAPGTPVGMFGFSILQWIPGERFRNDSDPMRFDQAKINSYFNYGGYISQPNQPFATAYIIMYPGSGFSGDRQPIHLYINVGELFHARVSFEGIGDLFSGNETDGFVNSLEFDPYEIFMGGKFVLPTSISVQFNGTITRNNNPTHFSLTTLLSNVRYKIINPLGGWHYILDIDYDSEGHLLPNEFGYHGKNDTIKLLIVLIDGQEIPFDLTFLRRVLDEDGVILTNTGFNLGGTAISWTLNNRYYIDPYNEATHILPLNAIFTFNDNAVHRELATDWEFGNSNAFSKTQSGYKLIWDTENTYKGAQYLAEVILADYGGVDQRAFVEIIVIERALREAYDGYKFIENPITYLASDLARELAVDAPFFPTLDSELYSAYTSNLAVPVLPRIIWNITDSEIGFGGFNKSIEGRLSYGSLSGERASATITANEWKFIEIVLPPPQAGETTQFINFNPVTLESVATSFMVRFEELTSSGVVIRFVEFYPLEAIGSHETESYKLRSVIDWGERTADSAHGTLGTVRFYNAHKQGSGLIFTAPSRYGYRYMQVSVNQIDLGFGWGGHLHEQFPRPVLVIDPFNPYVPSTVKARGIDLGTGEPSGIEFLMNISYESKILNFNAFMGGGYQEIIAKVVATDGGLSFDFVIDVYYLNRIPVAFYTTTSGFSTNPVAGRFVLGRVVNNVHNTSFYLDPLNPLTYDSSSGTYRMPNDIILEFVRDYDNYTDIDIRLLLESTALKFGLEHTLTNISFTHGEILLSGTLSGAPLYVSFNKYNLSYNSNDAGVITQINKGEVEHSTPLDIRFSLHLEVRNCTVFYTSVSEPYCTVCDLPKREFVQGLRICTEHDFSFSVQIANDGWRVDPYNIRFPERVLVTFVDINLPVREFAIGGAGASGARWIYDEAYLLRPGVINGTDPESAMFLPCHFIVLGAKIEITFPIVPRHINLENESNPLGMIPLSGGKLFVLKGQPLDEQLKTLYPYLYYEFDTPSGGKEIARAPLSFPSLSGFNTHEAGTFHDLRGRLGLVGAGGNIVFTLEVIDPKVFNIIMINNEYYDGGFIYEKIAVAMGAGGQHIPGAERSLLPSVIIVNDSRDFVTFYREPSYDIASGKVTFYCEYLFAGDFDSALIYGRFNPATDKYEKTLRFTYEIPLSVYDHQFVNLQDSYYLGRVENGNNIAVSEIFIPLGTHLHSSQMPLAISNVQGTQAVELFWDIENAFNIYRASSYRAFGYIKTLTGADRSFELTIHVVQDIFDREHHVLGLLPETGGTLNRDINLWLIRGYTGIPRPLEAEIALADFYRGDRDGIKGRPSFVMHYSADGGENWTVGSDPIAVGNYMLRITMTDFNVSGVAFYPFSIAPYQIFENYPVTFTFGHSTIGMVLDANENWIYPVFTKTFDNLPMVVGVNNLPRNSHYDYIYERRTAIGGWEQYIGQYSEPHLVGEYRLVLRLNADERNYTGNAEFMVYLNIVKHSADYSIYTSMVYNGWERHPDIHDKPAVLLDGMAIIYRYYSQQEGGVLLNINGIKNVGRYFVEVEIIGGDNYEDWKSGRTEVNITPMLITVQINKLESEYLSALMPRESAISFHDFNDHSASGLVGDDARIDRLSEFRSFFRVEWVGGTLSRWHTKGIYNLEFRDMDLSRTRMPNYQIMDYTDTSGNRDIYEITTLEGQLINGVVELMHEISAFAMNPTPNVRWYLMPGHYDHVVLNIDSAISIIGAYQDGDPSKIGVTFSSITILRGSLTLDIAGFTSRINSASLTIGRFAGDVMVSRTDFSSNLTVGFLFGSVGIRAEAGYIGTLNLENCRFHGLASAVYLWGGSIRASECVLENNQIGIHAQSPASVVLVNNRFLRSQTSAVVIFNKIDRENVIINANEFRGNNTAIRTLAELNEEIMMISNTFVNNAIAVERL
ncbi:MAG: right-handed parallel beta-helix repeat-containing protein [Firmicutes bacterium]|nr:right-handed parallel beta-helix repeat-containing protein [Bacillota bacterium]